MCTQYIHKKHGFPITLLDYKETEYCVRQLWRTHIMQNYDIFNFVKQKSQKGYMIQIHSSKRNNEYVTHHISISCGLEV